MHSDVIIKDMTSETPKKPWERTREEKLHDVVTGLKQKLQSLAYSKAAIRAAKRLSEGMFAELRANDSKEHATIKNAFAEVVDQCTRIQKSPNPRDEVRRMAETLIQRESDQEWSSSGVNEDSRTFLFRRYFDMINEGIPYHESSLRILPKLKEHRFDDSFYDDVVSKIGEIQLEVEGYYDSIVERERRDAALPPLTDAQILSDSLGYYEEEPVVTTQKPQMTLDQRLADIDRKIAITHERIKRLSAQQ